MPVYVSVWGQLVRFQLELFNILEHVEVAQQRFDFWAPWCIYLHDCLAARNLSGCVVAFILFCDEVESCIGIFTNWHEVKVESCVGIFTDWHEVKVEIFHQVQYGELTTFCKLAEWVIRFAEDGVNWSKVLPEIARTRAHYTPVSVINGGIFPVGTHPLLVD
jgi:hypothetical protein